LVGVNIASDLVLAILPLTFIWNLHRSRPEKIALIALMTANLTASTIALLRSILVLGTFGKVITAWGEVKSDILCGFELLLLLIAANLHCLKGPMHRILIDIGIVKNRPSDPSPNSFLNHMAGGSHFKRQTGDLGMMTDWGKSGGNTSDRLNIGQSATLDGCADQNMRSLAPKRESTAGDRKASECV
jgi:hypothetical protein